MTHPSWKANLMERSKISPRPTTFSFPLRDALTGTLTRTSAESYYSKLSIALDHRFGVESAIRSSGLLPPI